MNRHLGLLVATLLIASAGWPVKARGPLGLTATVVGHGHSADCTESVLAAALALGGAITFNCGAAPTIIIFNTQKLITTTVSLNGADLITLSGNNSTRLFYVTPGISLTLSHITLSNGFVADDGGAIYNYLGAALAIDHATFRKNVTDETHSGGAIFNRGDLTITSSTFDSNRSGNGGAVFTRFAASSAAISDSLFTHNATRDPTYGWGGALLLWDGAPVTVQGSQFISNTARWGGALYVFPNSSLTLTDSLVADNLADGGPSVDGSGGGIYNNARLVIVGTRIENNQVLRPMGVVDPGQRAGGAIYNAGSGSLRMSGGALRNNRAVYGAGLYTFGNASLETVTLAGNIAGIGGAIANVGTLDVSLTVSGTTLSGNQASNAAYPDIGVPSGSAIYNGSRLNATNSTLSGNSGARALDEINSIITLTSVTLANNPAGALGSYPGASSGQVRLFDALLAGNGSANCDPSLFSTFTSQSSLSSDTSCPAVTGGQNQSGVDPLLSPLGYHGGPTLTHMLAAASPAVDAGAGCPATDQRGVARPQGLACDIGAVERMANDAFFWLFLPLVRR